jgi:hypothetical protein
MERRAQAPPDVGTVEVLDQWRPGPVDGVPGRSGGDRRRRVGTVVAVLVAGAVVTSSWFGGSADGAGQGSPAAPTASTARVVAGPDDAPTRFDEPVGHHVVVLTMSGLMALDPDSGSYRELELGAIRSFSASPAVAPVGPDEVAVLFSDRSVGVVDLDARSVQRIARDVHAVFPSAEAGSSCYAPPAVPVARPVPPGEAGPVLLSSLGGRYRVEVHELRSTLRSFAVRVTDGATGRERWLRDLPHRPVLTPDGRYLLVGEPLRNRFTAYDVATLRSQTMQAPSSAGVTLDWENLAVLPGGPVS